MTIYFLTRSKDLLMLVCNRNTKCCSNSAGQATSLKGMDRHHYSLGCLKVGPDPNSYLSLSFRDAAWPVELLQNFVVLLFCLLSNTAVLQAIQQIKCCDSVK